MFVSHNHNFWSCAQLVVVFILLLSCCFESFLLEVENREQHELSSLHLNVEFSETLRAGGKANGGGKDDYDYYDDVEDIDSDDEDNAALDDIDATDYTNPHVDEDYKEDMGLLYTNQGKNFSKVVIGVVCCKSGFSNNYLEQTSLLLKSVLISAELYNVTRVDFHVFFEERQDEEYLLEKLEEMGYPSGHEQVDMNLIAHSALSIIPPKYRLRMIYKKKYKCGYTRFFFPSALPRVDSILHLGIDMVVTGNILKFWDFFKEMKGEQQMIAASKNFALSESTKKFGDVMDNRDRVAASNDFPHLHPKGVNSGVLLMNLTRLRAFDWEDKFLRAFQDYSKITSRNNQINAQKVMNVLLFYNPALYLPLPCYFNFGDMHCNGNIGKENSCLGQAKNDPFGIQLVHVNGPYNFAGGSSKSSVFTPLLRYFHQYNMTKKGNSRDNLLKDLVIPVRTSFDRRNKLSRCYGKLNKVFFNNFF